MNTGLPHGNVRTDAFLKWRHFSQRVDKLDVPKLMRNTVGRSQLTDDEAAAYQAPFPSREYQTAALVFPRLVPTHPDDPGAYENRKAIKKLRELELPVFMAWGEEDAITKPAEAMLRGVFRNVGADAAGCRAPGTSCRKTQARKSPRRFGIGCGRARSARLKTQSQNSGSRRTYRYLRGKWTSPCGAAFPGRGPAFQRVQPTKKPACKKGDPR